MTEFPLRADFDEVMRSIYRRTKAEASYDAHVFLGMLARHGGYQTARILIHSPRPQYGFEALWKRGRLDLTVEAHVLQERFDDLFTDHERDIRTERLRRHEVTDRELERFHRRGTRAR